ncbi:hypothetical protein LPJ63_002701 [Coemansia sp. RSA 2711]|nr:hypothetical protein LPJ63_002701 [Coemansia sp. RSA 2711]KAJ1838240.1 hypothetical protein LPJ70_005541 [Coemansia sp. RSA 2708]KAJ2307031.1 hypothetical protein IWW54_004534 [Coemansia sp. RSA 2705]KAJ2314591.1 hypothetical protein IWW52_004245 [Coemansia sp. RSA 2704]KAJ2369233.1 hypothetical protein H4S01_001123 [Coemansia sp. RSA 2610]KAJ2389480.1 hypothetical protein H4S02_002342 [Coemansia sp. RSA 2611]KAJ2725603.1 hypothetical protein H4R23_004127 [Coemansia sp. Cherry 401B]
MSTSNTESRVIKAPVAKVWAALKKQDFAFWSLVKSVELSASPCEVGGIRTTTFTDGTVQKHRLLELSDIGYSLTYEIIDSQPAVSTLSAQHTFKVIPITADDTSLVQWSSDFSSDNSLEVVMDAKYKKLDALEELSKALQN